MLFCSRGPLPGSEGDPEGKRLEKWKKDHKEDGRGGNEGAVGGDGAGVCPLHRISVHFNGEIVIIVTVNI